MKTKYTIAIITLKLLKGLLPEMYTFQPVIRPNLFGWECRNFYFAQGTAINASYIKGLKKLMYRAKHRRLYCTYKKNRVIPYNVFSAQIIDHRIIDEVGKTIKEI